MYDKEFHRDRSFAEFPVIVVSKDTFNERHVLKNCDIGCFYFWILNRLLNAFEI